MRVDEVAGNGLADIARLSPRHRTPDTQETKGGLSMRVDVVAGNMCQALTGGDEVGAGARLPLGRANLYAHR